MHSPATADNLEAALERAVSRFDDGSATGAQMRHHLGFGASGRRGRRLHARLALAAAEEESGRVEDALDAACAVEIVHEFSLVHDDIEDGDRMRRGRESVWSRFGLAHGINAGDALCAVAYLALLDGTAPRPPDLTVALTRALHEAHLAMCGGHGRDIAFETELLVSPAEYRAMVEGKTAALFGAACELGARSAGAGDQRAAAYARLGRTCGVGWQIEHDVMCTWGEDAVSAAGAADFRRTWTYPVVWAMAGPPSVARSSIAAAYAPSGSRAQRSNEGLRAALDGLGAREAALQAARAQFDAADVDARAQAIDPGERVRRVFEAGSALRRMSLS